jgi:integrase
MALDPVVTAEQRDRADGLTRALTVRVNKAGVPSWDCTWRDSSGRSMMRRVGLARLSRRRALANPYTEGAEGRNAADEPVHQERWRYEWEACPPRQAKAGALTARQAADRASDLVRAREAEVDREAAERASEGAPEVVAATLLSAGTAWVDWSVAMGRLRPSTKTDYVRTLGLLSRSDQLGNGKPIEQITAGDFESWRTAQFKRKRSARTLNKHRQILSSILQWCARSSDYPAVVADPMALVQKAKETKPGKLDHYSMSEVDEIAAVLRQGGHRTPKVMAVGPRKKGRRVVERPLTPDARAAMAAQDLQDAVMVITLAHAGLRVGEALGLRWRDLDFNGRAISVVQTWTSDTEGPPKSGSGRVVPMLPRAAEMLAQLGLRGDLTGPDDLVFVGEGIDGHLDDRAFAKRFKKAVRAAKLTRYENVEEWKPLRLHDLRHGYLSLAARTLPLHEVKELAGHSSIVTTSRYLHPANDPEQINRLAKVFGGGTVAELTESTTRP